jgi:hypothetical protein
MQYSHFWCANCSKLISGTPYYAYARSGSEGWFTKMQFCNSACYNTYKKKKGVTG